MWTRPITAACVAAALAVATAGSSAAPPVLPPVPPAFSWDTLPVFMHAMNQSAPLSNEQAAFMARFPLVTIEKSQGGTSPCPNATHRSVGGLLGDQASAEGSAAAGQCEEDRIIAAARAIKAAAASLGTTPRVLFYLNTIIDFTQYRLAATVAQNPEWLLRDVHGKPVTIRGSLRVFDLTQAGMRAAWLATAKYALDSGVVDGIFADRGRASAGVDLRRFTLKQGKAAAWDAAHKQMMTDLMAMVRANNASPGTTGTGIVIPNGYDGPTINGRMFENFRPNDTMSVPHGNNLHQLFNETRVTEVHVDHCTPGSALFNSTLAAYLVGAHEYTYYACTVGWTLNGGWTITPPEYKEALGAPSGNATRSSSGVWHRTFQHGAAVWLTEQSQQWQFPCIKWPSGATTGTLSDCERYNG